MENRKPVSFTLLVVAIILGVILFKQFDFKTLRFEQPALAVIYLIVFVVSVYFLIKRPKNQSEK
jgi:Ca2+/Na+ antiporter